MRKYAPRRGTTVHPDFIGPRIPNGLRDSFRPKRRVTSAKRPFHPLFIGPKLPPNIQSRLSSVRQRDRKRGGPSIITTSPHFIGPKMPRLEKKRLQERLRRAKNHADHLNKQRAYRAKNADSFAKYQADYRIANKDKLQAQATERSSVRRKADPSFALREVLASRVKIALAKQYSGKSKKTMDLIGCSIMELRAHLQSQFQPGMTWENRGIHGWHVDHIIPCSAFDLTDPDHQRMCFHYSNQRPMWARDNLAKGDRITPEAIALIVTSQETIETDVLPVYIERVG